jgi:hypothetical protein
MEDESARVAITILMQSHMFSFVTTTMRFSSNKSARIPLLYGILLHGFWARLNAEVVSMSICY